MRYAELVVEVQMEGKKFYNIKYKHNRKHNHNHNHTRVCSVVENSTKYNLLTETFCMSVFVHMWFGGRGAKGSNTLSVSIGGSTHKIFRRTPPPPPTAPNSFVFTHIFTKKCLHLRVHGSREILDPPLVSISHVVVLLIACLSGRFLQVLILAFNSCE